VLPSQSGSAFDWLAVVPTGSTTALGRIAEKSARATVAIKPARLRIWQEGGSSQSQALWILLLGGCREVSLQLPESSFKMIFAILHQFC
jgi:hypothetical protein